MKLVGFSDADWGSSEDHKSISGYYFTLNNGAAISWKSKRQSTVALSSCESEYVAMTVATREGLYLSQLLGDLVENGVVSNPLVDTSGFELFADNQGAISLTKNPVLHQRSKHFDLKLHFIRDLVDKKLVKISYVPTEDNVSDLMTKPFTKLKIQKFGRWLFGKL